MKIFIIGHTNIDTLKVGIALQSKNDDLSIAPSFISNEEHENSQYLYYMDKETINISYKNNALLYVYTNDNESIGMTYDDYYNNSIFCMSTHSFNIIPDVIFNGDNDTLIVWVDSNNIRPTDSDVLDIPYVEERIVSLNYLYFCNEDVETISNVVNKYVNGDEEIRNELLYDYEWYKNILNIF